MARWRLTEAHYLKVLDCFWEQTETDRDTGRQKRKQYPVPMHLNPNAPSDWNYRPGNGHITQGGNSFDEGAIIVCWEGKGERKDIVFIGDPTPSMEPLDDEAKEISAQFNWRDPINEFDAGLSYSEKMLIDLQTQVANALTGQTQQSNSDMAVIQKQMMDMMAQMTQAVGMIATALNQPQTSRRA